MAPRREEAYALEGAGDDGEDHDVTGEYGKSFVLRLEQSRRRSLYFLLVSVVWRDRPGVSSARIAGSGSWNQRADIT